MALGPATINVQAGKSASAPTFLDDLSFAGDSSYPTGGTVDFEAFVQGAAGIKEGRTIDAVIDIAGNATHYPVYNKATNKLMMFVRATGLEVANATNMSGTTFRFLVVSH
jgi:hypothetical protein